MEKRKKGAVVMPIEGESQIQLFQKKEIRRCMHENEWWFSASDVIEALAEVSDGGAYIRKLRERDEGLREGWDQIVTPLAYETPGGVQQVNFVSIEGIFRLMQSVPSKKAEPFKRWLAKVGFERLQEIQNPELAIKRAMTIYRSKGYDEGWIEARILNKASREKLEAEWHERGVHRPVEFAVLTDAISIETFGLRTGVHKALKGLGKSHNLRDNMTPIELTLSTLGEQATVEIAKKKNAHGMPANVQAAKQGGTIARGARIELERALGHRVVSKENYLTDRQKKKLLPEGTKDKIDDLLDDLRSDN